MSYLRDVSQCVTCVLLLILAGNHASYMMNPMECDTFSGHCIHVLCLLYYGVSCYALMLLDSQKKHCLCNTVLFAFIISCSLWLKDVLIYSRCVCLFLILIVFSLTVHRTASFCLVKRKIVTKYIKYKYLIISSYDFYFSPN